MKRLALLPVLAVLLYAAEVRAQEYSIDFVESQVLVREGSGAEAAVRRTAGVNPPDVPHVAVAFQVTFAYPAYPVQRQPAGITNDSTGLLLNFTVPNDGIFTAGISGTASITYTHPYTKQVVTKSIDVVVADDESRPVLQCDDMRVVETDPGGVHTIGCHLVWASAFRESGPVMITVGGNATNGADFELIDESWSLEPYQTDAQVRFRIFNDGLAEGMEYFFIQGGRVTIVDEDVTALVEPSQPRVMAGEVFDVAVSLPASVDEPQAGVIESADERIADLLGRRQVSVGHQPTLVPFRAGLAGSTTISVFFPGSDLLGTGSASIEVYDPGVTGGEGLDPLRPGQSITIPIRFTPAGDTFDFGVEVAPAGVIAAPYVLHIDGAGDGALDLTAIAPGKATISILAPSGRTLHEFDVRVEDILGIRGITPSSAPSARQTPVTISGSGFRGRCTAAFGALPATQVTIIDAATIQAVTPAHAAATVDVSVTCDGAIVRLPSAFTFTPPGRNRSVRH